MLRPSPVPLPTSLVVKKGSKTRSRTSGGIPQPVSVTDIFTYDPGKHPSAARSSRTTFRVSISSTPPSGIASRAFRARLSRAVSSSDGSTWHRHNRSSARSLTSHPPPTAWRMSPWNSEISSFTLTSLGLSLCRLEKPRSCCRQLCPSASGAQSGCSQLPDPAIIRRILDEFEVAGDHCKQVVEVVRDAAGELADGLHLLALVKLRLHEAARLQGVLVLGDVSDVDRDTLTGGERIERVPDTSAFAERLKAGRALLRHRLSKSAQNFRVVGKGLRQGHTDNITILGELRRGRPVDVVDAPVQIDDEHAVGRTLKNHGDPSRGFLGLLFRLGQLVLAMLQRIRHGVERVGNPREFGISLDVHTSGKFAEPPLVRGVDQLTQRAMDEQPGPQRCQDQYQRGAQGDQEDVSLRVILDLGEGLRLVEAEADNKGPGISPQG